MRCIFLWFLFFVSKFASAQQNQLQFSRLELANGLSNNQVTTIFKDNKGYLWFGTMAGLNRYDGYQFKVFRHDTRNPKSLSDDFINNIYELPDQKLLIDTRAGFNIYDLELQSFDQNAANYFKKIGIKTSVINAVKKDKLGNFWFNAGSGGIYIYLTQQNKTVHIPCRGTHPSQLGAAPVASIQTDAKEGMWVLHVDKTFEKFNIKSLKITQKVSVFEIKDKSSYRPLRFFIDKSDVVYIWSFEGQEGVTYYDSIQKINKVLTKKPGGLNNSLITGIIEDENGLIWISTDHGGINLLNKKDFSVSYITNREDDSKSLSQNSIVNLYKDPSGIIWIGTFKKGINYYHKNIIKFPLYRHFASNPNSLPFDDVNKFIEDHEGNIWIGTNGQGLMFFNRKTRKFKVYTHQPNNPNSLSNDIIVSLYIDQDKKLWIGSYFGGLDCFDGQNFKHFRYDKTNTNTLSDDRVWDILEADDQSLWIATLGGGIAVLDRDRQVFKRYKAYTGANSVASNYITALSKDKNGNIWIGTSSGLDFWQKRTQKFIHFNADPHGKNALSNGNVYDILADSYGYVWITTRDGLNRYDPKTGYFKVFRSEDGIADNSTLNIVEDRQGNFWLSTSKGLTLIKVKKNGKNLSYTFNNYDQHDGLQGREFNVNAAYITSKGELIFGGANGLNLFKPDDIISDFIKPTISFSDLQIANKSVDVGEEVNGSIVLTKALNSIDKLVLNHHQNVFSIEFTALNFFNPDKIRYKYMLEGFDKKFQEPVDKFRRATYTNLDPGNYIFKVISTNSAGDWVANEKHLSIKILPPFWRTPLAYILYVMAVLMALYLVRRRGINKLKTGFALEQERQEAKRMRDLDMLKIKFFTNVSHEFRTPLSLIITPMEKLIHQTADEGKKEQLKMVQRNSRRLLNLVNQLLDFRRMEVKELKLQATAGDIIGFIKELTFSFTDIAEKKNIELQFETDLISLVTQFDHDKVERILFNLLSNAFKFTPQGGAVDVMLTTEKNELNQTCLLLKVVDTGIGIEDDKLDKIFERFFQNEVPGSIVNQGSGIGLSITKEFVNLHGGKIWATSKLDEGSTFTVALPLIDTADISGQISIKKTVTVKKRMIDDQDFVQAVNLNKKPTLLLIEDNEDFRFYLKDNLKEYFHIYEAANGKEGWQRLLSAHPNLVVSDISMPELNGIDLCKKIKEDKRTAHIPVILLTALTTEETQLAGLQIGANDYVMKPFNFEILLSKIRNLLAQQEAFKKTYQKQVDINTVQDVIESVDEKFMRQLLVMIEKNLANADYSVDQLSSELNMSRVGLYKKLILLSGKSPVEFIRSYRLKKAEALLLKSQLSISEIAYSVGFNNPKYFSKYFKQEFNELPTVYRANQLNEKP
ncbi:hybrid sensor histidine kinase/response regulator [Pedobacter frigiditerrae]|uniref:histidine kinase n=1 Tax=Pedobacter frigiditerrae TaxID=2530452 RepID=A0A4R0MWZ7_9SPHI|nr:two-component regulator propeller domain-containing protein [Pedobacter frigiditerrae]TCC91791.1 hybrid sensor histidine kinase/response regulator [Pedobacter frigiditerrae]